MPIYVSLHKSLKNPPVQKQTIVLDSEPYEYNYLLPVISSGSTIASAQNAALATGGNLSVAFTDSTNNVIQVAYNASTARIHGYINVVCYKNTVPQESIFFLINQIAGNIALFRTEEMDTVLVSNQTGVTLGMGLFVGIGTQKTPLNHPYV